MNLGLRFKACSCWCRQSVILSMDVLLGKLTYRHIVGSLQWSMQFPWPAQQEVGLNITPSTEPNCSPEPVAALTDTGCMLCSAHNLLLFSSNSIRRCEENWCYLWWCPPGLPFETDRLLKDFHCRCFLLWIFSRYAGESSLYERLSVRVFCFCLFFADGGGKRHTKVEWRKKKDKLILRASLDCPPLTEQFIPSIDVAFIVFIDWRRPKE